MVRLTHYWMNCFFLWRSLLAYTWIELTISPVVLGFQPPNSTQVLLQLTYTFVFDKMSRKCAAGGSVVVVVSPLISLMEDQVASLRKRGVNAAIVTSGGGVSNEFWAIDDDLGKYSHLFCAAEALISSRWREALVRVRSIYTTSHAQPCNHADIICTLPLMNMCFGYG